MRTNGDSSNQNLESIRAALQALEPRGVTTRIPDSVRRRVVDYVLAERQRGQSWAELGKALGLSTTTLQRWSHNHALDQKNNALLPVTVIGTGEPLRNSAQDGKLVAVGASGVRIEGLDLNQAIELLRALG